MSGLFGVISHQPCATELFYGTDYHSHLGTRRAGLSTIDDGKMHLNIHNIENTQFKTKFNPDIHEMLGNKGIGVISDTDPQPIVCNSHLGRFAVCSVSRINNIAELEKECLDRRQQFTELSMGSTNPTELIALLITQGNNFAEGIAHVREKVRGSVSYLILTNDSIIAVRDRYGRTPLIIGKKEDGPETDYVVASESQSFTNLGYHEVRDVAPGEAVLITNDGLNTIVPPSGKNQICSFLWIYYGFPAANYEGINAEEVRYRLGEAMGKRDDVEADYVSGIPDSGVGMALGYAMGKHIPYKRGILKYTPTWSRSFMPTNQEARNLVAKMKLIPSEKVLKDKDVVFCDDSIVRGTQLRDQVRMLRNGKVKSIHVRISCPPLVYGCNYLNFSASKTDNELITRRIIAKLEGTDRLTPEVLRQYHDDTTPEYATMVEEIRKTIGVDSLKFNTLADLCAAIGMDKADVCTHCFDASSFGE